MLESNSRQGARWSVPTDLYSKIVLTIIAIALSLLAVRLPIASVRAQSDSSAMNLYVEPGTVAIRSSDGGTIGEGKMMIDLRSGDVWGFPTTASASPYPIDPNSSTPPVSKPLYLGRFDLSGIAAGH